MKARVITIDTVTTERVVFDLELSTFKPQAFQVAYEAWLRSPDGCGDLNALTSIMHWEKVDVAGLVAAWVSRDHLPDSLRSGPALVAGIVTAGPFSEPDDGPAEYRPEPVVAIRTTDRPIMAEVPPPSPLSHYHAGFRAIGNRTVEVFWHEDTTDSEQVGWYWRYALPLSPDHAWHGPFKMSMEAVEDAEAHPD